jgi:hypothetical protein
MPSETGKIREIQEPESGKAGATATFPYDRMTVERFREAFPRARWRDDLKAWFVPGTTAGRRLNQWLGRELGGTMSYADERGRDAFEFDPIESAYLEAAEDFRIRTPYSRSVVAELRQVPWAWWDPDLKAWRVPYRSTDELRRRWPAIEAAARRSEPEERRKRRQAHIGTVREFDDRARERRRHRYPLPMDALPPLDRVVMTHGCGAVIFTEVAGEWVEDEVREKHYPQVEPDDGPLVWGDWRRPTLAELVKTWPSRRPLGAAELGLGWWLPTLEELRGERRKARSIERAQATRRAKRPPA